MDTGISRLFRHFILGVAGACTLAVFSATAVAQDTAVIEEIIITAEKRAATVMDTALAVSAFDQAALDRNGVTKVEDLSQLVPNFKFGSLNLGFGGAQLTIRGISNDAITNDGDPSIAVHMDGVYFPRISSANALFYDVERVEILRGPQGTLYGRNTTSGTVNIIPRRPSSEKGFDTEITGGSDSLISLKGAFNIPFSDNAAARIAFTYAERDGLRGNSPAPDGDDLDELGVRASLLFDLNENASILLSGDYFEQSGNGTAMTAVPYDRSFDLSGFQYPFSPDPQDFPLNTTPRTDNADYGFKGELNWGLGATKLTAIGAFRVNERANTVDRDGTDEIPTVADLCRFNPPPRPCTAAVGPTVGNFAVTDQESESTTFEIRLSSDNPDSAFEWIIGAYYFEEELDTNFDAFLEGLRGAGFLGPNLVPPLPGPPAFLVLAADPAVRVNRFTDQASESLAFFGQGSLSFGSDDQFKITAGVRTTEDEKDDGDGSYVGFTLDPLTAPATIDAGSFDPTSPGAPTCTAGNGAITIFRCQIRNQSDDWSETSFKLGFDWQPTEDWLLYLSATEGYRSGGFNDANTYNPETLLAYEAGAKGRFMGGRAQAEFSYFYYDFEDQQVSQVVSAQIVTRNAAESTITGFEFTGTFVPTDKTRIDITASFLDAEYDVFTDVDDPQTPGIVPEDLSGNKLSKAPEFSVNIGFEPYIFEFGNGSSLTPRINFHYEDDYYLLPFNNPQNLQDSYTRTDLRLNYQFGDDGKYSLEAWVKNIEDDDVLGAQFTTPNSLLVPPNAPFIGLPPGAGREELLLGSYLPPRTYGLTFRASF
jgi:iron complex outermembrane recepter protein